MQAKNVLYATVGAPVVAVRKVGEGVTVLRTKISEGTSGYGQAAEKTIDSWAVEGEKVVARITDGKVVDEITAKVDLDQAKEQVSKLRDQLEDMLATWRSSFRPEKAESPAVKVGHSPRCQGPCRQEAGLQDRHQGFCCQDRQVNGCEDELCEDRVGQGRQGFLSSLLLTQRRGPLRGPFSVNGERLTDSAHREGFKSLAASIQPSTMASVGRRRTTLDWPLRPMILARSAVGLRRRRSRNVSTPAATRSSAYSAPTPLTRSRSE